MATSLVADAGGRLLLGNVTSLNDVTAAEQRYKSLQTTLRQSEVVAEVRNVDVTTTVAVLSVSCTIRSAPERCDWKYLWNGSCDRLCV